MFGYDKLKSLLQSEVVELTDFALLVQLTSGERQTTMDGREDDNATELLVHSGQSWLEVD